MNSSMKEKTWEVQKSEEEWKKVLTGEQYHILREKGTEMAGMGKWLNNKKKGFYYCIACENKLFSSEDKFDSGTGWPSFTQPATDKSVILADQYSLGYGHQIEVLCARCGGHHGHVFNDGPTKKEHPQGTGKRFCVNGNILNFEGKDGN
jgi:peptide-methionine (R)-S-oxide reductase